MGSLSISTLVMILMACILFSAFFSAAEIGMMSLNRYRLRHAVRKHQKRAVRVHDLLQRPDRLLSVILIGNTFATIFASAVDTVLTVKWFGDEGVTISTIILTLVILIFSEMLPKTVAAIFPEPIAYAVSLPLKWLQRLFAPLVWLSSFVANGILRLFGVDVTKKKSEALSTEELRTVLHEAGHLIPGEHRNMLVNILDLENVTVEDIMVPRNEILGINLSQSWDNILEQLETAQHTRLPLYRDSMNQIIGMIHLRKVATALVEEEFDEQRLLALADEPYFIVETATLYSQLLQFRKSKQRVGLVIDEYGEIQGLVTLEDILEEIVGQFTTDKADVSPDISPQDDGCIVVDGTITIRELNRQLDWKLPTDGPKTLNGLITEHLEFIPPAGTCLKIHNYFIEVIQVQNNRIKTAKMWQAYNER